METLRVAEVPQHKSWGLARRLTRLLRRKGSPAGSSVAYSVASDMLDSSMNSLSKLKLSGNMAAAYSLYAFFKSAAGGDGTAGGAVGAGRTELSQWLSEWRAEVLSVELAPLPYPQRQRRESGEPARKAAKFALPRPKSSEGRRPQHPHGLSASARSGERSSGPRCRGDQVERHRLCGRAGGGLR